MADHPYASILRRLSNQELILPYFERSILAENWPDSYQVTIDSAPYYGRGDGLFHPSSHPLKGARQLYYEFHPDHRDQFIREQRDVRGEMTLTMGSAIHGVIQTQMQMAGLIASPDDIEVEYLNEEHKVRGRVDFIVTHPNGSRIPVELKTRTSRLFNKQAKIERSWDAQLSIGLDNLGYEHGILLMLESGWPYNMREFWVTRNDALVAEVYEKFDYVRECIVTNTVPPHCCAYDSTDMKKCGARFMCWLKDAPQ